MPIAGVSRKELRPTYEAIVVGGGVQGLALAYELARRGMTDVLVCEASWPGGAASGKNGEMIRSAFSTPEWTAFFDVSLRKFHGLSDELDFNTLFTPAGHVTVVESAEAADLLVEQVASNASVGVKTELLDPARLGDFVPALNPAIAKWGGLVQPAGGFAHHDAVIWGYAKAAARLGVDIQAFTAVTAIEVVDGKVSGVVTDRGPISAPIVVDAAGSAAPAVAAMAGVEVPTVTWKVQALVTESLHPFLRPAMSLKSLLGYCHQTTRGEWVGGTEKHQMEPSTAKGVSLEDMRDTCQKMVYAFPRLAAARIVRSWSGTIDVTRDFGPIVGRSPVDGFWLDCGWAYGFMGAPGAGFLLAEAIATGTPPAVMDPFSFDRFESGRMLFDKSLVVTHGDEEG